MISNLAHESSFCAYGTDLAIYTMFVGIEEGAMARAHLYKRCLVKAWKLFF